jgi:hypothetical protein
MGKLDRVSAGLLALALAPALACSAPSAPREQAAAPALQAPTPAAKPDVVDPRFDRAGQLLPSGRHVSWLELPRGFRERPGSTDRAAVYEAENMPLAKVRAYLAARLIPDTVEYPPNGVAFRNALPAHTRLELPRLHAVALEINRARGEIRLSIDDLTPSRDPPLPVDIAARELARRRSRLE